MVKKIVLNVEDNEINRVILSEILSKHYRVLEAENGQEALDLLKQYKTKISLILLDVMMPVMDGYEAAGHIRSSIHPDGATVPIVAMTAYVFEEDVKRALDAGMNAHTAKPIDMEIVKALIRQLRRKK